MKPRGGREAEKNAARPVAVMLVERLILANSMAAAVMLDVLRKTEKRRLYMRRLIESTAGRVEWFQRVASGVVAQNGEGWTLAPQNLGRTAISHFSFPLYCTFVCNYITTQSSILIHNLIPSSLETLQDYLKIAIAIDLSTPPGYQGFCCSTRYLPPASGQLLTLAPTMAQRPILTKEQLKKKLQVSNFHPDAILRGAELTVVGGE